MNVFCFGGINAALESKYLNGKSEFPPLPLGKRSKILEGSNKINTIFPNVPRNQKPQYPGQMFLPHRVLIDGFSFYPGMLVNWRWGIKGYD